MTMPAATPRRKPFALPNARLAEAVSAEWEGRARYDAKAMPLTALSFTAIDITAEHREKIIDAMLAYAETDLLLYRSETQELQARQAEAWDEWVGWAKRRYEIHLEHTAGVMPVEQSPQAMAVLKRAAAACDDFALTALSALAQGLSSLLLALAVKEGALPAADAFRLSRVDEDYQAERWGEDSTALARAREIERDVKAAATLMQLLASGD